jgi:hypothetical protein
MDSLGKGESPVVIQISQAANASRATTLPKDSQRR